MSLSLTYPGVYIQELPSAVHTITGVATSIGAFIGWADQGPINQAVLVQSWSNFNTIFGGLDNRSYLGYAVSQFFANGGQQAYIVRLVAGNAGTASATIGGLALQAQNPGAWANHLAFVVTAASANSAGTKVFSLTLYMASTTTPVTYTLLESYNGLSIHPSDPTYAVTVINNDSQYIQFQSGNQGALSPVATGSASSPTSFGTSVVDGDVLTPEGSVPSDGSGANLGSANGDFETALTSATGGYANLAGVPIFNLLCVPGLSRTDIVQTLQTFCATERAFYIVDCPPKLAPSSVLVSLEPAGANSGAPPPTAGIPPTVNSANSAYYYPWVQAADPQAGGRPRIFPPSGFVAGQYAATDAARGIWKAPAGIETGLVGATGLDVVLTDLQNGSLNPYAVNCLRQFPVLGNVIWGARTMLGADAEGSQWKYIPIRRLAMYIESSLYQGTQWAVFEPNDAPLWSQIRLNIGSFMQQLFLKGAFQGSSPQQAYFVKCDAENNPQANIDQGILTVTVGFAPLYPAEFVVIQIQQMMAGAASS
jgi:phage tail sheath protein FI